MGKVYTRFQTKTDTYMAYIGEHPPPPCPGLLTHG